MGPSKLLEEPLQRLPPRSIEWNDRIFFTYASELDVWLWWRNEVEGFRKPENSAWLCFVLIVLEGWVCCLNVSALVIVIVLGVVVVILFVAAVALVFTP